MASFLRESLASGAGMSAIAIKAHVYQLINRLHALGAPVFLPEGSPEDAIATALNMLKLRHIVIEDNGLIRVDPAMRDVLSYYANTIAHWETDLFWEKRRPHDEPKNAVRG